MNDVHGMLLIKKKKDCYPLPIRGVHGPGWVGLSYFFDPTQKLRFVGLVTQLNSKLFTTRPDPTLHFLLGSGWVVNFFFFKFYLYTIYNYLDTILYRLY